MIRIYSIGAAALIAAMLGVLGWLVFAGRGGDDQFAQCRDTAISGGAGSIGGPFELVDQDGRTVTDQDVITMPTILYFGYTFCPDVCPLDTARNAEAVELLEDAGHTTQPVFISVDPERDTPEVLSEFTSIFHDRMIGLTGSDEQIRAASREYRTFYSVQPSEDEFYLVDHSTFSYLVLPEHGVVEVFRRDQSAEEIAERTACFIERM
ncbi:MAG: cytochrome oxidase biogenesis copper metallochaperone PrrC [Rhodobacteraceae bacterium HLUCCA12]|nr:MAG: cytochrome oxidase biogenesis copper metallochaperone PrrC [Rhodobacteraceae bacterium HLUCCA12]